MYSVNRYVPSGILRIAARDPRLGIVEDRVDPLGHRGKPELPHHLLHAPVARS